jgi:hypothetical protein
VSIPDFAQINRREDRLSLWVGVLAIGVVLLAGIVGVLVLQVQSTAEDTNDLVVLLEDRTPLFAEARGLAGYAAGNHQALAESAQQLLLLGTPDDPCPPQLGEV